MLKYIFILGRNWHLSLVELNQIIQTNEYKGKITDYSACAAIIEFEKGDLNDYELAKLQYRLGSTQKICKIVDYVDIAKFQEAFPETIGDEHPGVMIDARRNIENILKDAAYPIFGKINKKLNYFIASSIYPVEFRDPYYKTLLNYFLHFSNKTWVKILKEKGAKSALYYRYPEENIKSGNLNPIFPHHYMKYELYKPEKKEIVYAFTEEGLYIGYSVQVTNSNETKFIDEERPYFNPKAAIPPKFAKTMINFLKLKQPYQNQRILDPFCGSGTILLFAYSQNLNVYGSDIDKNALEGTIKNIKWMEQYLEKPKKIDFKKQFVLSDVKDLESKFENITFDGVVSEPILLPYFTELPRYNEVWKIVDETVIPTYKAAFQVLSKLLKKGARACFTSAAIQTLDGGKVRINLIDISKEFGFRQVDSMKKDTITEKSNKNLSLETRNKIPFDTSSKHLNREFYILELNK